MKRELFYDAKYDALVTKAAEEIAMEGAAAPEAEAAGGVGDLGLGDLGGEEPAADLGGEEPAADLGGAEGAGEEPALLAAPSAKRDTPEKYYPHKLHPLDAKKSYHTKGGKGKPYKPVTTDKRRGPGSRQKNMKGAYSRELARNTPRNVGAYHRSGIEIGIYESDTTNYDTIAREEEERSLFETRQEVLQLIEQMEKINGETET
jgi:hypothetical protein